MTDTPITQAIARRDVAVKIVCDDCGWKSELFPDKDSAFEAAQDHEDIEHKGSKIKWEYIH